MNLKNVIETLDYHFKNLRSDYYLQLNAPLKGSEISTLETRYSVKVPDGLKILYQWKNGQNSGCSQAFADNSLFLPLEQALDTAEELTGMIGSDFKTENWWNKSWIPFLGNGGGDYICIDDSGIFTGLKGQLIKYRHNRAERIVISPDIQVYFESINRYYGITDQSQYDEFFIVEPAEGFPVKFDLS